LLRLPIAHAEGNYEDSLERLDTLEAAGQVVFRYVQPDGSPAAGGGTADEWNPNGAARAIAGIANARGNVLGLMPHPERCAEEILGNADGLKIFESIVQLGAPMPAIPATSASGYGGRR
jgi:phosphoribosylformylglycinamidine synthase